MHSLNMPAQEQGGRVVSSLKFLMTSEIQLLHLDSRLRQSTNV